MADGWDFHTIAFPDQKDHPRLQMTDRVTAFGRLDSGVFSSLASGVSGHTAAAGSALASLTQERDKALQNFRLEANVLKQKIQNAQNQIRSLRKQIRDLQAVVPPDTDAIADLNRQLREAVSELSRRTSELSKLNSGGVHLSSQLPGTAESGEF
ncbi:MAG: hypothetical protein R3C11_29975 [Planctomycetaceae bacterium]